MSLSLCRLSDELLSELLQFAGRDWRLAAYNVRALRDQLDSVASAAHSLAKQWLTWQELHQATDAALSSLSTATSGVQRFIAAKGAECMEALRQLLCDEVWSLAAQPQAASQLTPSVETEESDARAASRPPDTPIAVSWTSSPASEGRHALGRASHTSPTLSSPNTSLATSPGQAWRLPSLHLPPSICLAFARVVCDVHLRDAPRLLPAALYRLLVLDEQPTAASSEADGGSAEYAVCRTLLSISRCLDHVLHFHLLHSLTRFRLLAALQRALSPAGAISAALSSDLDELATVSIADTHSLLLIAAYIANILQALQVGHSCLPPHQQRDIESRRCDSCRQPLSPSHVTLACGHAVCYACMLSRVSTAGATCGLCGGVNSMAQLRNDTLRSALSLLSAQPQQSHTHHQQRQEAAVQTAGQAHAVFFDSSLSPTPPSPMTPPTAAVTMELVMGQASADSAGVTAHSPHSGSMLLGRGSISSASSPAMSETRRISAEQTPSPKRTASYSQLSHSASTSSLVSSSTLSSSSSSSSSSLSPSPSDSPTSPPPFALGHSRRSSVPDRLTSTASAPSSLHSFSSHPNTPQRVTARRSKSARKLSEVSSPTSGRTITAAAAASSTPRVVPPPRSPPSAASPTASFLVPLMATVVEPPYLIAAELLHHPNLLSSCHQCKSAKPRNSLMLCSSPAERTFNGMRKCRKKYCNLCLRRCYDCAFELGATRWTCPACEGLCSCASCQRGREQRRATELAAAAAERTSSSAESEADEEQDDCSMDGAMEHEHSHSHQK